MQFASLYVGDLHPDCGEATLYEAFSEAGNVASCRVCRDSQTRKSLGYGYVNYYSVQDAEKALDMLNYMTIKGKPCRVMWSQRDPERRRNNASNVFVKGLDPTIDNKALHDTFSIFGHILSCKVSTDMKGNSRGYGFVHYEAEEAAKEAISRVNGMKIAGSTVFVGPFMKREELEAAGEDAFTNLYVKNIPPTWDDPKITEVFSEFGEVCSSVLQVTEEGKRFALVNFKSGADARKAIDALHRKDMRSEVGVEAAGETGANESAGDKPSAADEGADAPKAEEGHPAHLLYVQKAQTRAERKAALEEERKKRKGAGKGARSGVRLCVRNLAEEVNSDKLKELFDPLGTVLAVILKTDEATGKHRGVGFVIMATMEEATKAIEEANGQTVEGKALNVTLSERRRRGERDGEEGEGKGKGREGREGKGKGKGARGKGKEGAGGKGGIPPPGVPGMPAPGAFPPRPPFGPGVPGLPPGYPMPPFHPGLPGLPPRPGMPGPAYSLPPAVAAAAAGKGAAFPPPFGHLPPGGRPPLPFPQGYPGFPGMPPMPRPLPGAPLAVPPGAPPAALTREALERLPPQQQKQQLGERLYQLNFRHQPALAGKLTGMMLELQNSEIYGLLESEEKLKKKISEAVKVLEKQAAK